MKIIKKIFIGFFVMILSFSLVGCFGVDDSNVGDTDNGFGVITPGPVQKTFTVRFYIDGVVDSYMTVTNSQVFTPPQIPYKKNFEIIGWANKDGVIQDFKKPFSSATDFYAVYKPDYAQIINHLSENSANVKIEKTVYNKGFLGIKTNVASGQGSGVIFFDQHDNYYLLTNEHVTNKSGREYADFKITDYKGNTYTGYLQKNTEQAQYDLSVLYFKKGKEKLHVVQRAMKNPYIEEEVISVGQPSGQNNYITFGKVSKYQKISLKNGFNPSFNVLTHSAPVAPGSSGGALLNLDFKLVGVNFAVSNNLSGEYVSSSSIPIEIVNHYLYEHFFI